MNAIILGSEHGAAGGLELWEPKSVSGLKETITQLSSSSLYLHSESDHHQLQLRVQKPPDAAASSFYKTSQSDVVSVAPPTEGEYTASKPSPSASHCKLCHMDADGPERCHPSIPSCCQELGVVGAHYRADYQLGRRASCSCVELAARLIAAEAAPPSELANTGSRREAFV